MGERGWASALAQAAGLGVLLAAHTAVGAAVGYYLDTRLQTGPWLLLAGSLAGMGLGLRQVLASVRRLEGSR